MLLTSANCTFPVSTSSFASEHTGIECLTTGWRFKISDVWKGVPALRSYFLAAMVTPTCLLMPDNLVDKSRYHSTEFNKKNNMMQKVYLEANVADNWNLLHTWPCILWQFKLQIENMKSVWLDGWSMKMK